MAIPSSPHFVLLPFMAQGHLIPMVDIGKLLAKRNAIVSILLTPNNANRVKPMIDLAILSGLNIRLLYLKFPSVEAGLPEGCESFDMISSTEDAWKFFVAISKIKDQVHDLLHKLDTFPSCLIADMCFTWASGIARSLEIPRILFHGFCCFSLYCFFEFSATKEYKEVTSDFEYFKIPNLPDRIEMTKAQIRGSVQDIQSSGWSKFREEIEREEDESFGTIVNTFQELEPEYIKLYKKVKKGKKLWCIGPVSLCNKDESDKEQRGNKASVDKTQIFKWLDSQKQASVIYVCLGSLAKLPMLQMVELGLGLESSNHPFIWVIRDSTEEFNNWLLEQNYEERIKERGVLIKGWAPQVLILSHSSIGCFFTHCGWNSSIEGISAGVPMITWPVLAEQFCNESLIVSVIKSGLKGGVEVPFGFGETMVSEVQVKRDEIKKVIEDVMDEGEEGRVRREKAEELGKAAKMAVEEGGSSYENITLLINDVMEFKKDEKQPEDDKRPPNDGDCEIGSSSSSSSSCTITVN